MNINRREFLAASATVAAGFGLGWAPGANWVSAAEAPFQTKLHKALIIGEPTENRLQELKEAGFDGVEGGVIGLEKAKRCRETAEKLGMRIHSVLRGWAEFNSRDQSRFEASFALSESALKTAQAFGADAVLLVPCRIGGMPMPRPWEFLVEFDEATGHVEKVAAGDNSPYAAYIEAHNHAIDTSREAVKRLIPLAEKTGVIIALENVWNNLWVKPAIFKHFVGSFRNPWVKAYFDIGNHVKYAPPEEWILTLGSLIAKCHVKDFKVNREARNGGEFVDIREGDIHWPAVRRALDQVGYNGWMTIEGGNLSLAEHSRRLDLILAGK